MRVILESLRPDNGPLNIAYKKVYDEAADLLMVQNTKYG
jgi:hypothetical protein